MNSKLKLKVKTNLKKDFENEKSGGKDLRLLNYFDMKEGEKMTILLIPDEESRLWHKFSVHGPNLKTQGVERIACAKKSSNEHCPACQRAYDFLNEGKEEGNNYDEYKEEAKRWFPKDSTIAQCIVLESPIDINEAPDGNQVKAIYLPYAIENIIKEAVVEGIVDEEDICMTPFVIKKTLNQGGHASYANSYFSRKTVAEDDLAFFDDLTVEPFNYDELDLIPSPSSTAEVGAWVEKTDALLDQKSSEGSKEEDDDDKKDATPKATKSAVKTQSKKRTSSKYDEDGDEGNGEEDGDDAGEEDNNPPADTKKSDLRSRLEGLKR